MKSSAYIGRVGGLAVALGVGAAIFSNQGAACAETGSSDGSSSSSPNTSSSPSNGPSPSSGSSLTHSSSSPSAGSGALDSNAGSPTSGSVEAAAVKHTDGSNNKDGSSTTTPAGVAVSTGGAIAGTHTAGSTPADVETPLQATTGKDNTEKEPQPNVVQPTVSVSHRTSDSESSEPVPTEATVSAPKPTPDVTSQPQESQVEALPVAEASTATSTSIEQAPAPAATLKAVQPPAVEAVITEFLTGATSPGSTSDAPFTPSAPPIEAALLAFARRQSDDQPAITNTAINPPMTTQVYTTAVSGDPLTAVANGVLSLANPFLGPNASALAVPLQLLYQVPVIGPLMRAGVPSLTGPINALSQVPLVGPVIRAVAVAVGLLPTFSSHVNGQAFMSAAQLRAWHEQLDALGLRATGSPAQDRYIDDLITMLSEAGLQPGQITTQDVEFERWSLDHWALDVTDADGTVTHVNTPAYIPYSGVTGEAGVTSDLVHLSDVKGISRDDVEGKIVVFDVPLTEIPEPLFLALQYPGKMYDPNSEILSGGTYKRPYLNGLVPVLDQLEEYGAAGAVGVLDYPEEAVAGSYFPFDGVLRDIPGVYVDREVGAQLKTQAQQGVSATIVMPATVETATTRNIVAVIPGKNYGTADDEVVMIHSHTDGTNGLEDNGPYIAVAMSKYLAEIPQTERDATYAILLTTGHFAGGIGIDAFLKDSRNADLIAKTKVAMTIEHVGALEYGEVDGHMVPTGRYEPGVWWSRDHAGVVDGAYAQLVQADGGPSGVLFPLYDLLGGSAAAPGLPWPGDGGYLDAGGITDVNYITGPTYLLNYGVNTADRVDFERVRNAAIAMTDQALYYGRTPKADLLASKGLFGIGPVGALYSTGILGKIISRLGLF